MSELSDDPWALYEALQMLDDEINAEDGEREETVLNATVTPTETATPKEDTNKNNNSFFKNLAIIGGVAVGSALAAPIAIPAAVTAVGFGSGGIAAGSFAAWFMSLGGGVTPAVVAVCQSIGATGAIAGSTQVVAGAVGAAATATAAMRQ